MSPRVLRLPDPAASDALGAALAGGLPPGHGLQLALHGELGAGKSSVGRALLRALGVTGTIRSPTYTLVERYPLPSGECAHLDLYRIADPGELDYLGLDDPGEFRLLLVEWPERGGRSLPAPDLRLHLSVDGDGRIATLQPESARGVRWLAAVADAMATDAGGGRLSDA